MSKKGILVVIDGTDGSGKATQTKLLVSRLEKEGKKIKLADFPRYGNKSAGPVEQYLNGHYGNAKEVNSYQASILFAVDRYAASMEIRRWLEEGHIVISNRYVSSNMGHQAGKINENNEREIFLDWLHELEFKILGIPVPDLTLLLYLDPAIGQKRVDKKGYRKYVGGKKRDIHEADITHLTDAANAYKYVAEKYDWPIIDASKSIEEVHEDLWAEVASLVL